MEKKTVKKISHYKIISKIGEGGMGEVYLGEDPTLGRKVAVKILTDECCEDSEKLQRFLQEAKTASALNHPNIITIFEFGKHEDSHYIASEYIEGKELGLLLEDRLPIESVIDISIQVVSALKKAHEAGIIHRDIKPNNIMVRDDGIVKILDFGLAKLTASGLRDDKPRSPGKEDKTLIAAQQLPSGPASPNTIPGLVMGTPNYMSPEQARGRDIDHQTDLFSFGTVLYEMVTGNKPFFGETASDIIAAVLTKRPQAVREVIPDFPAKMESIIEKALNKQKSERYLTAAEMLSDLNEVRRELQIQKHLAGGSGATTSAPFGNTTLQFPSSEGRNSIAVLPFVNMSVDERRDYFSEGLTEEIIVNLSKLQVMKVVPRGSMPDSAREGKSHKQTADLLGVRYLLEGSVRKQGEDLRISAQLIDTADQAYLWSEIYSGTIKDIFEIQEKVATEIVQALEVTLSPAEEKILKQRYTENTEAYQLYLQGRFFWNKRSIDGLNTAISYFEKAIAIDPEYALAWAGIADSYGLLAEFGTIPHKELYPKSEEAVKKALEIDDGLAEVHTSYASLLLFNSWDWERSQKEFKRALELNPGYATAHHWYSFWFLAMGDLESAIRLISKAAELDPVSTAILKDKGMIYCYAGRYDKAIEIAKKTLELDPQYPAAHRLMSLCYMGLEKYDEAIKENTKWGGLTGNKPEADFCLAHIYALSGKRQEARDLIGRLEKESRGVDNIYRGLAIVYSALGEIERGLDMLEKSFELKEIALLSIKVDPKLENLRSEARFQVLLDKMGVAR